MKQNLQVEHILIWMVSHQDSFWHRGKWKRQLIHVPLEGCGYVGERERDWFAAIVGLKNKPVFSIFQSLDSDPCFTRFRKKFKPIDMVAVPDSPYCLIIQVAHQDKNFQVDFGFLKTKFSLLVHFVMCKISVPLDWTQTIHRKCSF